MGIVKTTSKGLSKKEINRFKKADLMKIIRNEGLPCNSKMLKRDLVACIFKHNKLRSSLSAPPKRVMSEKQKNNLAKFRLGKDFKNEKIVKPRAQYDAELKKIEDIDAPLEKSISNNKEIKRDLPSKKNNEKNFNKLVSVSNLKVDDNVKLRFMGDHQKENKRVIDEARKKSMRKIAVEEKAEELEDTLLTTEEKQNELNRQTREKLRPDVKKAMDELVRLAKARRQELIKERASGGERAGADLSIIDEDSEEDRDEDEKDETLETPEDKDFLTLTTSLNDWDIIIDGMSRDERIKAFDDERQERKNKLFLESILNRSVKTGFINPRDGRFVSYRSKLFKDLLVRFENSLSSREFNLLSEFVAGERRQTLTKGKKILTKKEKEIQRDRLDRQNKKKKKQKKSTRPKQKKQ